MRSAIQILAHLLRESAFDGRFDCETHGNLYTMNCEGCRAKINAALHDEDVQRECTVTGRSCSWCGHINEVSPRLAIFCVMCGHMAQVARVECMCSRCAKGVA